MIDKRWATWGLWIQGLTWAGTIIVIVLAIFHFVKK